ncbi:MAG: HTH domain-containing protein, partial [Bacillota bacterium]
MNSELNPDDAPLAWSGRLFSLRRLLEGGHFCSGQHLAFQLRVSRTSVWKSLSALRALGYEIE